MRRAPLLAPWLVFLFACGDSTSPDVQPAALRVTPPSQAQAGRPFSLTVEAVGLDGGGPIASVNGPVELSVSAGSITPSTANLVAGTATLGDGQTEVVPIDETFTASGSLSDPDCGSTSADFSGAIARDFECGGFGPQGSHSRARISFSFELAGQAPIRLVGSVDPVQAGAPAGFQLLFEGIDVSWPDAAVELDESGLPGSGVHRLDLLLESRPEYGVPSAGNFSLELFFGE